MSTTEFADEAEIFDAATVSEPDPAAAAAPAAVSAEPEPDTPAAVEPPAPQADERGDLNVALRHEREERKRLQQQNAQMLEMLKGFQPQKPAEPEAPKPDILIDPDEWAKGKVAPVLEQMTQRFEALSKRMAIQQHGAESVQAAYDALDEAISRGQINRDAVLSELRQSMDPFGDIMAWHERHKALSEIGNDPKSYRERVRAEIMAELGGQTPAAAPQNTPAKPAAPSIPSVNRAIGNAGAPQSTSITEDDIFNSAPAFGKPRKA